MSEPISAFAAYNAKGKKGGGGAARKSNQKKNTSGTNKTGSKGKGAAKNKGKTSPAKGKAEGTKDKLQENMKAVAATAIKAALAVAKAKTTGKSSNKTAPTTTAKSPTKTATTTTIKQTHTNKSPATSKGRKSSTAAEVTAKTSNSSIKESQIDELVDELMSVSPKKLTKAQLKKKKELEAYLVEKVKIMDAEEGIDTVVNGDGESGNASSCDSSDDGEFSSEYTLNSYSDESDEGEEETDETDSDDDGESESSGSPCDNSKCDNCVPKKSITTKRKSNGAEAAAATNGIADAKKSKSMLAGTKNSSNNTSRKTAAKASAKTSPNKISAKRVSVAESVKLEPLSPPSNGVKMNSIAEGMKAVRWLLQPVTDKNFFESYWEKNALFVTGRPANYFTNLISFAKIDQMLLQNHIEFTKNIDITSYKNGVRDTLNPEGRAMPPVVWDFYGQGCSIRLLNPHTYIPALYTLNSTLQEFFHCLVGANVYLTPPNSQGFAPHYDDIEAFVLQVEGRKRWKLYQPFEPEQVLARFSSRNFEQSEIGKPIFDQVLKPGDLLYFPRGTIHQASTEPGFHSLHITLSVYQKHAYADLFERMMPIILQKAIASNVDMRRGLPLYTFQNAGVAFSNVDTKERHELQQNVTRLLKKCLDLPLDEVVDLAVDQLAKKYQHEALPPEILSSERIRTVYGSRSNVNEKGECICDYDIDLRTNVRLLRANILRLVEEEGKTRIYYHLDNSKEYCQYEATFIEIDPIEAGSVEVLLKSYPEYVGVSQLPLPTDDHKIQVATALWERGFLMLEKAFR